jgi:M6 family metalloprotease-like protein
VRVSPTYLLLGALSVVLLPVGRIVARPGRRPLPAERRELPGFDFTTDGVWRGRAREVARQRAALLTSGRFSELNAPMAAGAVGTSGPAITGVLQVPVVLFAYHDTPPAALRDTAVYREILFGSTPPLGRPYTYRSYYEDLSHGLFSVQGDVFGYAALSGNEATYTGDTSSTGAAADPYGTMNCNGVWSFAAESSMQVGLQEALARLDSTVDFSRYDADGDGVTDLVVFIQPGLDGACDSPHLWSHRFHLLKLFTTNDPAPGGGFERVSNYILESGVGGISSCDSTQYMPIGTVVHETGHGLGLPDLYDVSYATQGIGNWGLMGSGNYSTPDSPSRMVAWSLNQLGWVALVPLTTTGTYQFGAAPVSDTAFYVRAGGYNSHGEYYLLENRQAVQADTALIRVTGPGLLLWHIDSARVEAGLPYNSVNVGYLHGVRLEEADGQCLTNGCNRGDGGDPYPGTSDNRLFSLGTNPPAVTAYGGEFVGFAIDSIRQLVPDGAMAFRLHYGAFSHVAASDPRAAIQVDGSSYPEFVGLFDDGSSHTIAIPDTQLAYGRIELAFQSWSDGGAASHQITGSFTGATYTATVTVRNRLVVKVDPHGSVTCSIGPCPSQAFFTPGASITLTATPDSGFALGVWAGPDTTADSLDLTVSMLHPYDLEVRFDTLMTFRLTHPRPAGVMGRMYADTLFVDGGHPGEHLWSLVSGTPPPGIGVGYYGTISGVPTATGTYPFVLRVQSSAQTLDFTDTISVTAPVLDQQAVVQQLLTGGSSLTSDDLRYLDLLGNNNCGISVTPACYDVGDFLAWVRETGATPLGPLPPAIVHAARSAAPPGRGGRP